MSQAQTPRLDPAERRGLLVTAAGDVFAARGYTRAGLAEVAVHAGVSKTLLYHYFPDGRPELYREVIKEIAEQVIAVIHAAVRAPLSVDRRLAEVVDALLGYFEEHPDAYRLLVLEPWGSADAGVIGEATAARARLVGELNRLLAPAGRGVQETLGGGAAAMGALLHVCELRMADQLTSDQAAEVAHRFVEGGLAALGLV